MSGVQTLTVTAEEGEQRLDRWFRRRFPHVTQGRIEKLCRTGEIRVDGGRVKAATRVAPGQSVRVPPLPDAAAPAAVRPASGVSDADAEMIRGCVLYRDDHIIALNKPPGLPTQGGTGQTRHVDGLAEALRFGLDEKPRLVHRLDRDTSGVILTAKTKPAAGFLGKALMAKRFRKTYLAVLAAAPDPKGGVIDVALRRDSIGREVSMKPCAADHPEAEAALTRYRTLAHNERAALVELSPETGRMHQLRAHLASIGRPILGDPRYGGALTLGGEPVPRLMLHAARLRFPHPDGGDKHIEAPMPADMAALIAAAGLPEQTAPLAR